MKARLLFLALFALPLAALAQMPQTTTFQGYLATPAGTPVADGAYSLTFRLYKTETRGAVLWEETQNVTVSAGVFGAVLGTRTPLEVPFDQPYWVGISVEVRPRRTRRHPGGSSQSATGHAAWRGSWRYRSR